MPVQSCVHNLRAAFRYRRYRAARRSVVAIPADTLSGNRVRQTGLDRLAKAETELSHSLPSAVFRRFAATPVAVILAAEGQSGCYGACDTSPQRPKCFASAANAKWRDLYCDDSHCYLP